MNHNLHYLLCALTITSVSCSNSNFAGSNGNSNAPARSSQKNSDPNSPNNTLSNTPTQNGANGNNGTIGEPVNISSDQGSITVNRCSANVSVPGTSNIYLAGAANGTSIIYAQGEHPSFNGTSDTAPAQSPILVQMSSPSCLQAGNKLYFDVAGVINHGGGSPDSSADGNATENGVSTILSFLKGPTRGMSNIKGPIDAMVGVFLDGNVPDGQMPPTMLDFSADTTRNAPEYSPQLRQVFFIGDGKTSAQISQRFIVPAGATRLYLGILDSWGYWNNSVGGLTGGVLWQAPQSSSNISTPTP